MACLEQMKLLAEKHEKTVAQVTRMISENRCGRGVAVCFVIRKYHCVFKSILASEPGSIKSHWLVDMPRVTRDLALTRQNTPAFPLCGPGGLELVHLQGHSAHSGCTNAGAGLVVHSFHRLELGDGAC